jgi:hypothetical protein
MSITIGPDARAQANGESILDQEWRGLVAEAAAAAGIEQARAGAVRRTRAAPEPMGVVRPAAGGPSHAVASRPARVEVEVVRGRRAPDAAVPASLTGRLIERASASAVSADVDPDALELRLTCQAGRFRVHDQALSSFPTSRSGPFGTYNVARAGIDAAIPAAQLVGARSGKVVAGVCVPMSFDNTLQRVWRLAVPSRDNLRSDDRPHLAVAGVRGRVELSVEGAGGAGCCAREFLRRSSSAHLPGDPSGFGPVRGMHMLEVDLERVEPGADIAIVVEVTLTSLLAGNLDDYEPDAPFYAGMDFGGGGSVRLPNECLSSFEIPLTPLIANEAISVAHLGFVPGG